ncbi:hypothetical protein WA026_014007 [Henosepilachna vigintioctopunctata]|uniref:Odorant receptor n=1 Tax=Henosepilachna vigintioctopunctata TaxID=420089 RepID=A0AAW1U6J2_9CUCU
MKGESNFAMNTVVLQKFVYLLKYNNACPIDEETFNFAFTSKFFGLSAICGLPLVIGMAGYLYVTMQRDLWQESLPSIVTMVEMLSATSMVCLQFFHTKNALIGLKMMDKYEFGEPEECRKFCQWIEPIIVPLHHLIRIVCYLVTFYDFINNSYCTSTELEGDPGYICGITIPLWYPFKANYFFVRLLLNICLLLVLTKCMPVLNIIAVMTIVKSSLILYRTQALRHIIRTDKTNGAHDKTKSMFCYIFCNMMKL